MGEEEVSGEVGKNCAMKFVEPFEFMNGVVVWPNIAVKQCDMDPVRLHVLCDGVEYDIIAEDREDCLVFSLEHDTPIASARMLSFTTMIASVSMRISSVPRRSFSELLE